MPARAATHSSLSEWSIKICSGTEKLVEEALAAEALMDLSAGLPLLEAM